MRSLSPREGQGFAQVYEVRHNLLIPQVCSLLTHMPWWVPLEEPLLCPYTVQDSDPTHPHPLPLRASNPTPLTLKLSLSLCDCECSHLLQTQSWKLEAERDILHVFIQSKSPA